MTIFKTSHSSISKHLQTVHMNQLFKIIISLSLVLSIVGLTTVDVFAAPVQMKVDCLCVDKEYLLYGDEQAEKIGDECFVTVDLDALAEEDEEVDNEEGLSIGDRTGASAILSPLGILFSQSGMKDTFVSLLKTVFKGHTEKYHKFIDEEIFGAAIEKISSYQDSEELEKYLASQEGECKEDGADSNPKPECVIERALCSYEKYVGVLFHEAGQALVNDGIASDDLDSVLVTLQNRDQAILDEAQHAQEALDTTIAVYSQFFQTYRLHLRFKELIVHLAKVRAVTGSLHELVGCIPNKFVGVATTKCN